MKYIYTNTNTQVDSLLVSDYLRPLSDYTSQLATFEHHLDVLRKMVTKENTSVHPYLHHINALLNKAVLTVRAATSDSMQVQQFAVQEKVHSRQKQETQPRFHATTKPPGRKRTPTTLKASEGEKATIIESLDSTSISVNNDWLKHYCST